MKDENKANSFIQRIKQKVLEQKPYGNETQHFEAEVSTKLCPNCGAGRAKTDGLTKCVYCGFEFISLGLTDGINLKKTDNSK